MTTPAIKLKESAQSPTPDDFLRCEQELQISLPPAYRELLLKHNGGRPTPAYVPYVRKYFFKVEMLLPIVQDSTPNDVVSETNRLRATAEVPHRFVVIAKLEDDRYLLLDCNPGDAGLLCVWQDYGEKFLFQNPGFENAFRMPFVVGELLQQIGTMSKRVSTAVGPDPVAEYSQFWSEAGLSEKARMKMEDRLRTGFDINCTLPDREHPICSLIRNESFELAAYVLTLGVHRTRELLQRRHDFWTHIRDDKSSNYRATARRKLKLIEAALASL